MHRGRCICIYIITRHSLIWIYSSTNMSSCRVYLSLSISILINYYRCTVSITSRGCAGMQSFVIIKNLACLINVIMSQIRFEVNMHIVIVFNCFASFLFLWSLLLIRSFMLFGLVIFYVLIMLHITGLRHYSFIFIYKQLSLLRYQLLSAFTFQTPRQISCFQLCTSQVHPEA